MASPADIAKQVEESKAKVMAILKANKTKNFVDRVVNAQKYPDMATPKEYGDPKQRSTHLLSYATDDKGAFVFPIIAYDAKKKSLFVPKDPVKHALDNDEMIRFKDEKEAAWFTQNYKLAMPKKTEDMTTDEALDSLWEEVKK